jgi:hypothetical protein
MSEIGDFVPARIFSPGQARAMGEAFELALGRIEGPDLNGADNDLKRELIAHCIIELANRGETDAKKMADRVFALIKL